MIKIEKVQGKLKLVGKGQQVSMNQLFSEHLNENEIRVDILNGRLKLDGFDGSQEELIEYVFHDSWGMLRCTRDDLKTYLEWKNDEKSESKFKEIQRQVTSLETHIQYLTDQINVLSKHMSQRNGCGKPEVVTLKDIKELFPEYSLGSLRNIISRNKYRDENEKCYKSLLEIGQFRLVFRKPLNGKRWVADSLDFDPQKAVTLSGRFQQTVRERLKHGKKSQLMELVKLFFL